MTVGRSQQFVKSKKIENINENTNEDTNENIYENLIDKINENTNENITENIIEQDHGTRSFKKIIEQDGYSNIYYLYN